MLRNTFIIALTVLMAVLTPLVFAYAKLLSIPMYVAFMTEDGAASAGHFLAWVVVIFWLGTTLYVFDKIQ